jgi:hypothetical protein
VNLSVAASTLAARKDWWRDDAVPEKAQIHEGNSIAEIKKTPEFGIPAEEFRVSGCDLFGI